MRSQEAPEVDGQMRVLRERMDTLSELMDELMLRQVGPPGWKSMGNREISQESIGKSMGKSIGNLEKIC